MNYLKANVYFWKAPISMASSWIRAYAVYMHYSHVCIPYCSVIMHMNVYVNINARVVSVVFYSFHGVMLVVGSIIIGVNHFVLSLLKISTVMFIIGFLQLPMSLVY